MLSKVNVIFEGICHETKDSPFTKNSSQVIRTCEHLLLLNDTCAGAQWVLNFLFFYLKKGKPKRQIYLCGIFYSWDLSVFAKDKEEARRQEKRHTTTKSEKTCKKRRV